jgi:hypothetical protein
MVFDPNDNLPLVGTRRSMLGVRPLTDITLIPPGDVNGNVAVDRSGLSVSEDWRTLPPHLVPEELDDELNGASGKSMKVFVHGIGPFAEGPVAHSLELLFKPNSTTSGVVCPTAVVPLAQYQADLQATRNQWVEDPS